MGTIRHTIGTLELFFGDKKDSIPLAEIRDCETRFSGSLLNHADIYFTRQEHGTAGIEVTQELRATSPSFSQTADFLTTRCPDLRLGIVTADCIPLVLYDPRNQACALIHAGWRGSVAAIVQKALAHMQQRYGTSPRELHAVIGPAARSCCYQIQEDVAIVLRSCAWGEHVVREVNGALYADMVDFNVNVLHSGGVAKRAIDLQYALCTIRNGNYCSYRREGSTARRQITSVRMHSV